MNHQRNDERAALTLESLYWISGMSTDDTAEHEMNQLGWGWIDQAIVAAEGAACYVLAWEDVDGADAEKEKAAMAASRDCWDDRVGDDDELGPRQSAYLAETLLEGRRRRRECTGVGSG
jgi:hypothetical protein